MPQVGTDNVLLGLSGVDSSVVAALLHKAIGDQADLRVRRQRPAAPAEGEQVMAMFAENMGVKVIRANAERFLGQPGRRESDPEKKRKIIGRTFIVRCFRCPVQQTGQHQVLAQGTIYPDVIESAGAKSGKAHVIKVHHNVGGLPENEPQAGRTAARTVPG